VPKSSFPDATALTNRLTGLGVTSTPTGVVLADELEAAIEALEEETGRSPFLVDANDVTKKFSPPFDDWISLGGPWTSITSVTADGSALTVNEDYWLEPTTAPYTSVKFAYPQLGLPQTIVIVGKRGTSIPTELYNAVLDYAAGKVYKTAAIAGSVDSGMITELQQDSVKIKLAGGGSGAMDTGSMLMESALKTFGKYRQLTVGNFT
jgi:hypothetical protein